MPITVSPLTPPVLTPLVHITGSSDFIGPLPIGSRFVLTLDVDGTERTPVVASIPTSSVAFEYQFLGPAPFGVSQTVSGDVAEVGAQVHFSVQLEDGNGVILDDGASQSVPWQPNDSLPQQVFVERSSSGSGLTPTQAQQLQETHESTFPSILVDELTLVNLTQQGPVGGFVNAQLPNPCFGVIVRIASVPDDLLPGTPDGDYWTKTLAVIRIFRGSDMWQRIPVHTSSKLYSLLDSSVVAGLTAVTATQWLLDLSVQVSFLQGVTGTVFLMLLP